jgi:molybdate transport system ATP-binding protein
MSDLRLEVSLRRGDFALDIDTRIPGRGVTAVLGASGSGKSTLLRLIAGLERPQAGRVAHGETVWVDTRTRTFLPPQRRRVGLVFQDYALFEHMSVAANVGYGVARAERATRTADWLARTQLTELAARLPSQLSGGQRQRVALARALASAPDVVLLDEPFSALDASLRRHLRAEPLAPEGMCQRPVVLVTHDLDEARQLADHLAVLVQGRLHRIGPAARVVAEPGTVQAAQALGWRNLLPVVGCDGSIVRGSWGEIRLDTSPPPRTAWIGIRPEHVSPRVPGKKTGGLQAQLARVVELGALRELHCELADGTMVCVHRPWDAPVQAPGTPLSLHLPSVHVRALRDVRADDAASVPEDSRLPLVSGALPA